MCHAERSEASLLDRHQALVVVEILHSLRSFRMTRQGYYYIVEEIIGVQHAHRSHRPGGVW
jgi:hypothetical protein